MATDAAPLPPGDEAPDRDQATAPSRYFTPTGEPCPRSVRLDGTVEGTAHCHGCGFCLLGSGLV